MPLPTLPAGAAAAVFAQNLLAAPLPHALPPGFPPGANAAAGSIESLHGPGLQAAERQWSHYAASTSDLKRAPSVHGFSAGLQAPAAMEQHAGPLGARAMPPAACATGNHTHSARGGPPMRGLACYLAGQGPAVAEAKALVAELKARAAAAAGEVTWHLARRGAGGQATTTGALGEHGIHAGGGNGGGVRARARAAACTAALSSTVHALTPPWGMGGLWLDHVWNQHP